MPLSQEARDQYRTKGWCVVNDVFTPAETIAIRDLATEIACAQELDGQMGNTDRADDGTLLPRKINAPFTKHADFRRFATNATLRALVSDLLGHEALLLRDQIFMKPPRFGSAKPYHQDNFYFKCSPPDGVLTAWIAMDDVDEANGCLRYIDGSHRDGIVPHEPVPGEAHNLAIPDAAIDRSRESLAIVRLGGVVFHHSETMHTSYRNASDRWRRAYATHWGHAGVTAVGDVVDTALYHDPAYAELVGQAV